MVINCKKPCKKKRSTMLTVEQMVDVALGTPEIGAVNFNVLHALIHVIIQQLNIQKCLVEFKGYDSDRMEGIILSAKPGPILKLSEYMIDVNDGKNCPPGREKSSKHGKDEEETKEEAKDGRRPPCECTGKKRKEEDREKSGKRDEEEKKATRREESEAADEAESKKIREVKKPRSCPCKERDQRKEQASPDETLKAVPSSYYGSDSEGTCQTIVRVEPVAERCDSWRARPALAHESMVRLEEKVAMLQDAFEALEQMPTNEELKKRTQGSGGVSTPVKDLWQLYNLNKRVESCEGTIEKLASMIEDLVKETCNFREAVMVIADAVDEIECADQTGRNCCAALQGRSGGGTAPEKPASQKPAPQRPAPEKSARTAPKPGEVQAVTFKDCDGKPCPEAEEPEAARSATEVLPPEAEAEPEDPAEEPTPEEEPASAPEPPGKPAAERKPEAAPAASATSAPSADAPEMSIPLSEMTGIGPEFYKMSAGEKFHLLKEYVDCLLCQVKHVSENPPASQLTTKLCALMSVQKQVDGLEREWREFLTTFGEEGASGLTRTLSSVRGDIDRVLMLQSKLMSEQQEAGVILKNVKAEAEDLRAVKADLELVEDLLAAKADAALLNRKVSHDQFDAACDDLTRGLDEALDRLLQQEAMWNEAMEELQKGLDTKLDKVEIMPLKEFISKKLKCLQEKLKQLAQLRKDAEAAGAKSRIIR